MLYDTNRFKNMLKKVLTERVVAIERGVNKVLKYTEICELFLIGNVAASDPSVFDTVAPTSRINGLRE